MTVLLIGKTIYKVFHSIYKWRRKQMETLLPLHRGAALLHLPGPEQISLLSPTSEYSSDPFEGLQL